MKHLNEYFFHRWSAADNQGLLVLYADGQRKITENRWWVLHRFAYIFQIYKITAWTCSEWFWIWKHFDFWCWPWTCENRHVERRIWIYELYSARARKCSSLKGYFNYLATKKCVLDSNPVEQLEVPKKKKSLPKYLTLEQSLELLNAVDGDYKERDYCILTLFLNCGLRVSEMASLNYTDIHQDDTMRVVGKGNKERIIYLNSACVSAIENYMRVRPVDGVKDKYALFISRNHRRMSVKTIQAMVYKYLEKIGLNAQGYSCHKLRHTAATLMYQYGGVDIRVLKDVLGHENLGTTEIYTHLSSEQMKNAAEKNPLSKVKQKSNKKSDEKQ